MVAYMLSNNINQTIQFSKTFNHIYLSLKIIKNRHMTNISTMQLNNNSVIGATILFYWNQTLLFCYKCVDNSFIGDISSSYFHTLSGCGSVDRIPCSQYPMILSWNCSKIEVHDVL